MNVAVGDLARIIKVDHYDIVCSKLKVGDLCVVRNFNKAGIYTWNVWIIDHRSHTIAFELWQLDDNALERVSSGTLEESLNLLKLSYA